MPQPTVDELIRRQYLCLLGLHRWSAQPEGTRCLDCAGLKPGSTSLRPPLVLSAPGAPLPRRQHTLRRVAAAQAAHRPRWRPVDRR
jgi:hypothetical protein